MNFSSQLIESVQEVLRLAGKGDFKIITAESCTGGLLSSLFTEVAGSSKVFEHGFVTYSNQSKINLIGVKEETLETFGAVSKEVALEMAEGAAIAGKTNHQNIISIAITGIAGPEGGSVKKPVGTVFIAASFFCESLKVNSENSSERKNSLVKKFHFAGSRSEVRNKTIFEALKMTKELFLRSSA